MTAEGADSNPLYHALQQIVFELSAEGSGRIRIDVGPCGQPLIRITDQPTGAASAADSSSLIRALSGTSRSIILELSQCTYLSSTDLGLIARIASVQKNCGGRMYVVGASRQAKKMMSLVGLDEVCELCHALSEIPSR